MGIKDYNTTQTNPNIDRDSSAAIILTTTEVDQDKTVESGY